jgi:DNA polymerase I-like protein with 3'-5' exonuclease and polymerase domains
MSDIYKAGLGKYVLWPIHDELAASVPDKGTAAKLRDYMRDSIPLKVPVLVTAKMGPNWGTLTEVEL